MQLSEKERNLVITMCRNDLRVSYAAEELHYHPNTIKYQVERLASKTGYDCRTFYGAFHLLLEILWEEKTRV